MGVKRKPFQGVLNILRFNWHFYVVAGIILVSLISYRKTFPEWAQVAALWIGIAAIAAIVLSLGVSFYVYDVSELYHLAWLPSLGKSSVVNIHAGFDETSVLIQDRFPETRLTVCDFYDPAHHTEVSIRRARKAYPPYPGTIPVAPNQFPFSGSSFDYALVIFAAHEVRDVGERIALFREMHRVIRPNGTIVVTEHVRDFANSLAYTFGVFHFFPRTAWMKTFDEANLVVRKEIKTTPFITTFVLQHGDSR